MSKTRIFLSSTCYDLAAVRESLREHILLLGHDPVLSEYPSFPVSPDVTAIENCKRNVQRGTDIFVLIIGGRRGALDPASGRSVTNAEYERAKEQGIPCFVFINRSVSTLFHVWKKNPDVDFTPTVDFPEVFKFIERVQEENRWTFTFEKTGEIKESLTIQLSIMLRELIERSRSNTLVLQPDYADDSPEAQRLAREKPEYWEFFLTAELLKARFAEVRAKFRRQQAGLLRIPSYIMSGRQFLKWVPVKIQDFGSMAEAFEAALPPIQEAWGPPGKSGDPRKIRAAVNQLVSYCDQLLQWEQDLSAAVPPEPARALRDSMKGWTETVLLELEKLPTELLKPFEGGAKPKGALSIMLTLQAPSMEKLYSEFRALERRHGDWLDS